MKIAKLKSLQAHQPWFGVRSHYEVDLLDPLPRDSPACPGGGMALLYFTMEPGETFPTHTHPNSRIILIWRGAGAVEIDGERFMLEEFDSFALPPGTPHTFAAGRTGLTILSVHSTSIHPEDPSFMTISEGYVPD